MKKWIFKLLIILGLSSTAMAQQSKQIDAVKVEFLTKKLDLSPEEAQRFWPVFNKYQKEIKQVISQRRAERMSFKNSGGAPVDEIKYESLILEIRKRYNKDFLQVLPAQKVAMIYPAEREFREKLIKELGERRHKQ
ncbi:hypothetical protein [Desertivirga xinjiangensis]|uniref:hypothetical protein n=1 Tax=Desertivirga xinjiangensis TaxID=539206 RepID=UPI00210C627F|nr:hypothetical protein [Pedobacter xinjiangensis]